jgi:hypothetical protein
MITISSGITKTKDTTKDRLRHNYRLEESHKNIENNNTNYSINSGSEIIDISTIPKSERQEKLKTAKLNYQDALEENFQLLQREKREGKISRIERKSRLQPITEGVVNFGGVYDMKKDKLSVIKEKTKKFNSYIDENLEEVCKLVYENLQKFAKEVNTEISDLVLHRDEKGINHFHYLIKTYDNQTGKKLNFKHDIDKVGTKLQDFISKDFEKLNIFRAEKDKKNIKMTKEQLIEYQEAQELIIELQEEAEELKKTNNDYEDILTNIRKNIDTLLSIQDEKTVMKMRDKLTYILETGNDNIQEKLEKLFNKSERQITAIKKKNTTDKK